MTDYSLVEEIETKKPYELYKTRSKGLYYLLKKYPVDKYKIRDFAEGNVDDYISNLNNRYIVHYYNFHKDEKYITFLLEYCQGGTLEEYINKNIRKNGYRFRFKENEIYRFLLDILHALSQLHQSNMAHGNLSPSTIYITVNREFLLGDFLENFVLERIDGVDEVINRNPDYTAPEIADNPSYIPDKRSDMYSLGCILYELCTSLPYDHHDFHPSNYDDLYLNDLIRDLLSKDPDRRPTVSQILGNRYIQDKIIGFSQYTLLNEFIRDSPELASNMDVDKILNQDGTVVATPGITPISSPVRNNIIDINGVKSPLSAPDAPSLADSNQDQTDQLLRQQQLANFNPENILTFYQGNSISVLPFTLSDVINQINTSNFNTWFEPLDSERYWIIPSNKISNRYPAVPFLNDKQIDEFKSQDGYKSFKRIIVQVIDYYGFRIDKNNIVKYNQSNAFGNTLLGMNDNEKELRFISRLLNTLQIFNMNNLKISFIHQLHQNVAYANSRYGKACNLNKSFQNYWVKFAPQDVAAKFSV